MDQHQASVFRSLFLGMGSDATKDGSEMASHMPLLHLLATHWSFGSVVELGVGRGWSTISLLSALLPSGKKLISYDVAPQRKSEATKNWRLPQGHPALELWDFRVKGGVDAATDFEGNSVSLVFIDTTHEYAYTKAELTAWNQKVSQRGVICGHDYFLHLRPDWAAQSGVKKAVDEFAAQHADRWRLQVFPHDEGLFVLWPKEVVGS